MRFIRSKLILIIVFVSIFISCSRVTDIDLLDYKKGIYYYNLQNYDSSIYYFKKFLRKVPRYKEIADTIINAHNFLAKSLENTGKYELAILVYNDLIKYLQKTYKDNSKFAYVYLEMAKIYEKMGLKEQAMNYRKLYEKYKK
ncbi:MAG: tetratricopeptide repeat protein [candidate division WOR-3 bacterium]